MQPELSQPIETADFSIIPGGSHYIAIVNTDTNKPTRYLYGYESFEKAQEAVIGLNSDVTFQTRRALYQEGSPLYTAHTKPVDSPIDEFLEVRAPAGTKS